MTSLSYKLARWVDRDVDEVARMTLPTRARVATTSRVPSRANIQPTTPAMIIHALQPGAVAGFVGNRR